MKLQVLLVDDSATMRAMLRKILNLSGLPVAKFHEAGNGQEGLDVLAAQWIDLVLVDLNMPVMGGLEMIDRVRQQAELAELPIIVVSTESSATRIAEIKSRHIHFIHKPFTPEQVRAIVQQYWELSAARLTEQLLIQVGQEVFERLASLSLQVDRRPDRQPAGEKYCAEVGFSGSMQGLVSVVVPGTMMPVIYRNMAGEGEEPTYDQQLDALGELTNVLCGNLLGRLAGPEPIFDLAAPQVAQVGAATENKGRRTSIRMAMDEDWMELALQVESQEATRAAAPAGSDF